MSTSLSLLDVVRRLMPNYYYNFKENSVLSKQTYSRKRGKEAIHPLRNTL